MTAPCGYPALASGIFRPVGVVAMLVVNGAARRLLRIAVDEGVIKDQKPGRRLENSHYPLGQLHAKSNP